MWTFLVLAVSIQIFIRAQRRGAGRERAIVTIFGSAGLGLAFGLSAYSHGIERGAALWTFALMAAGVTGPFLAAHAPRLAAAMPWRLPRWSAPFLPATHTAPK